MTEFISSTPQVKHQDLTKRIVLIDTMHTVDPRLLRRRVIMDTFNDESLTKERAYELLDELAGLEASLQSDPAEESGEEMEF